MRYVNDLNMHMFTIKNYERYISVIVKQDISYQKNKEYLDYTLVKEEDSLFWSLYIIVFGMDKFIMNK